MAERYIMRNKSLGFTRNGIESHEFLVFDEEGREVQRIAATSEHMREGAQRRGLEFISPARAYQLT